MISKDTLLNRRFLFEKIFHKLDNSIFEKKYILRKTFLGTLSGESTFLLGQSGVGKSLIGTTLSEFFKNSNLIKYILNNHANGSA